MDNEPRPVAYDILADLQFGAAIAGILLISGFDLRHSIGGGLLASGLGVAALTDCISLVNRLKRAFRRAGSEERKS